MCGGLATRMQSGIEKPLLRIGSRPMVERVYDALKESKEFDRVIAVVSPNTPLTERHVRSLGVKVIQSSGRGIASDIILVLSSCKPERVFVVPADLALINKALVSTIVEKAKCVSESAAVSIVCELGYVNKLGVRPSVTLTTEGIACCHSGITIFDTSRISPGEVVSEKYLTVNEPGAAVNVNTKEDLAQAEKLLVERA
jgi:adenosylcobinamide-phosphate guanylyltransferase